MLEKSWATKPKNKVPMALFSGKPQNTLWNRHIAVQKAKVARANAGKGQGRPFIAKLYGRALYTGQGALENWRDATIKFLQILFIFLSSCFREASQQWALAAQALQWLQQGAANWRVQPWYGIVFKTLQARCRANGQGRATGQCAFSFEAQKPEPMVAAVLQQGGTEFDNSWRLCSSAPAPPSLKQALHQVQGGNKNGNRNFTGIRQGGGSKRNTPQSSTTFNTMVCDQKRGQVETNYRLQGNKQLPATKTVQIRELAGNFSFFEKRNVGCKNRPQACLFPSWNSRPIERVHLYPSRGKGVPISRGMFWHEHPPPAMAKFNEGISQKMEKSGVSVLGVPRRYFTGWKFPSNDSKTVGQNAGGFGKFWNGCKFKEIPTNSYSGGGSSRIHSGFQKWNIASSPRKIESNKERVRETFNPFRNGLQKNGRNFGCNQVLFNGNAFSKGLYRSAGAICKPAGNFGLGSKSSNSLPIKGTSQRNELPNGTMERKKVSGENSCKGVTFRFLPNSLGRGGCNKWINDPRVLERKENFTYKCKGIGGSHKHSNVPSQAKGTCVPQGRQCSNVLLFNKEWGKDPKFKSNGQAIFALVHDKSGNFGHTISQKFTGFSRCPKQVGSGQGGLHYEQTSVRIPGKENGPLHKTHGGHVCIPRKPPTKKVCFQIPPLASSRGGCPKMSFGKFPRLLCKSPMENNQPMAAQITRKQTPQMHANSPILGFKCMVAPNSENARKGDPQFFNKTVSGHVQKLLGRIHALSTLAPSLSNCIREGLQAKQVSPEAQDTYLKGLKSLQRYDASFKLFCGFCICKNFKLMEASLQAISGMLLEFNKLMPTHTRFVYSSLLLIPGMDQLTFSPILRQMKRQWNISTVRYASFYDASDPLGKLVERDLNWNSIPDVRMQLLLCCRFLMLCRNVDLERMYRTISMVGQKPFVLIQRKGWLKPQWEGMVQIPEIPQICPWTLLKKYVDLTRHLVKEGSPVFISLVPPIVPLKANSIGSLTRNGLNSLGIDTTVWKPHSTRGAGVTMMKKLGMSSEEVCEIGKWKNVNAFQSHYMRLNASKTLGTKISQLVHKVSPLRSAEADLTWTTRKYDLGGNVREAEAQSNGEPTLPPLNVDVEVGGSEWLQKLSNVDKFSNDATAHWVPSHLDSMSSQWPFDTTIEAVSCQSEVATSSNACLGPVSPMPITFNAVPVVPHSPHVPDVSAISASFALGEKTPKIKSQKRTGSVHDSPPRKFAFASQKSKDMQD